MKSTYKMIHQDELREDFDSLEYLMDYYSSLQNSMVMWRSEKEYIEKIRKGLNNARELAENLKIEDFETERWMNAKIDHVDIYGRFDIMMDGEIIDIKTGGEWESDITQMEFYALIYYLNKYIIPRGRLIYLLSGKIKPIKFNLKSLESLLTDILNVGEKIEKREFPPNMGDHCKLCPYRVVCRF